MGQLLPQVRPGLATLDLRDGWARFVLARRCPFGCRQRLWLKDGETDNIPTPKIRWVRALCRL